MNILLLQFLIILIVGLLLGYTTNNKSQIKTFGIICFIPMLICRSFLDINSVSDLFFYDLGFQQIADAKFVDIFKMEIWGVKIPEPGFRLFMKLSSVFSSSFVLFLTIYSVIWIGGYYKVIKEYSPYFIVSLLLLLLGSYNQSLFVLRQHLAMLIVFLSYKSIVDRDLKKFLIYMLLAFSMHLTAIVAFPLYFIYQIKSKRKLLGLLLVTIVVISLTFSVGLNYFGLKLSGYESYIDNEDVANIKSGLFMLFTLLSYVMVMKNKVFEPGINKLLFINLTLGTIFLFVGVGFNPTNRLSMYFSGVQFLAIPVLMKNCKSTFMRNSFLILFLAINFYQAYLGSSYHFVESFSF